MSSEGAEVELRRRIVGKFLRQKRVDAGLTQSDVAKHMGYTTAQFISNWERGVALPPMESMPRLAELFRVPSKLFIKTLHTYQEQMTGLRQQQIADLFRPVKRRRSH